VAVGTWWAVELSPVDAKVSRPAELARSLAQIILERAWGAQPREGCANRAFVLPEALQCWHGSTGRAVEPCWAFQHCGCLPQVGAIEAGSA